MSVMVPLSWIDLKSIQMARFTPGWCLPFFSGRVRVPLRTMNTSQKT